MDLLDPVAIDAFTERFLTSGQPRLRPPIISAPYLTN
jgi:hypothetical protein